MVHENNLKNIDVRFLAISSCLDGHIRSGKSSLFDTIYAEDSVGLSISTLVNFLSGEA